jgi:hypothetical protein
MTVKRFSSNSSNITSLFATEVSFLAALHICHKPFTILNFALMHLTTSLPICLCQCTCFFRPTRPHQSVLTPQFLLHIRCDVVRVTWCHGNCTFRIILIQQVHSYLVKFVELSVLAKVGLVTAKINCCYLLQK